VVVARNILIGSPSWDDIEGKAKPYVTMKDNLLDAPRTLLQKGTPQINVNAPEVRAIGFAPLPKQIGLFSSPDRALWPVKHEVTKRIWPQNSGGAVKSHPRAPVHVAHVAAAPKIDGVVSEGEYAGAEFPLAETPNRDKIQKTAGTARVSHDGQRLYVVVTIPLAKPEKIVGQGAWGSADAVELVFRRHGTLPGTTFLLQGYADGRNLASLDAGASKEATDKLLKSVKFAAHVAQNSWTAEWSVPLSEAGIAFGPGLTLGFNLGARRLESDDWLVWTGTGRENWRLDGAGRIILD